LEIKNIRSLFNTAEKLLIILRKKWPADLPISRDGAYELVNPVVRQRFSDIGQEIWPWKLQTPEALGARQLSDNLSKWRVTPFTAIRCKPSAQDSPKA
jgi:hypothetical protein